MDIHYTNELGRIYWTTVDVTFKPNKHSYYFQFSVHMHYIVTKGVAWFLIGTQGRVFNEHDPKYLRCIMLECGHVYIRTKKKKIYLNRRTGLRSAAASNHGEP